jgi:hypothetical protein
LNGLDLAEPFSEGVANIQRGDRSFVIDHSGHTLFSLDAPPFAGHVTVSGSFHEGLCSFLQPVGDFFRSGYMTKAGKIAVKPIFEDASVFSEQLAAVKLPGKGFGYINGRGKFIIEPRFSGATDFHEGLAGVKVGEKWGFIDKTGRFVISPKYTKVGTFSEALAPVEISDQKWIYIDHAGQSVIKTPYTEANGFHQGIATVSDSLYTGGCVINRFFHFIDRRNGSLKINKRLGTCKENSEGMLPFRLLNTDVNVTPLWGFADRKSNILIKPKYQDVESFSNGLAGVQLNGKWGFVDHHGRMVIRPQFDAIRPFTEGYAVVHFEKK